jgi:hypothetical protein
VADVCAYAFSAGAQEAFAFAVHARIANLAASGLHLYPHELTLRMSPAL